MQAIIRSSSAAIRLVISQKQFNCGKQILLAFIHGFTLPFRPRQFEANGPEIALGGGFDHCSELSLHSDHSFAQP